MSISISQGNSFNNSNSMVKSNFLIGDGTAQYVIGLPIDQDKEHTVTKNIVIGNNTSQNILATFRTSKELIDFVLEMESSGTEGSEHRLRLKIRESSNTLSDEQLREKHKHIIEMFEDKSSEVRRELDEELKSLSLIYEKSSLECILLNLKVDTIEKLNAFVTRFRAGDLEKIMVIIAKQCHTTSTFDVQLHLSVNLSATEREKISTVSKYIDRNPKERTILKPKSIPSGFSLVVRKKADRTQGHLVSPETLTQKVAEATVASLSKTHLLEDTSGIDFHFEKFCSLKTEGYTKKPSRDAVLQYASNTMSESMRGCVGVIHVNGVQAGTCFRVGSKYIMTAFHVVKAIHTETCDNCLDEQKVHVEFPDEDEKHLAKMVYFDEDIDVAVLSFVTENSERTSLNRVMTCHPGQSFYTISYLKSQRKTRRSLIASTDYTTRFSSSQLVIFDSDDFEYGCSGSPGIITNVDGETGFLTMLLGSFTTDTDAWYYGVKMTEVKKRISKENPFLANELFGLFDRIHDQKTPFHHEDWRTIKKVDKNNSTHLRQRLTRRINGS